MSYNQDHNIINKAYNKKAEMERERDGIVTPSKSKNPRVGNAKERLIAGFIVSIPILLFIYLIYNSIMEIISLQ